MKTKIARCSFALSQEVHELLIEFIETKQKETGFKIVLSSVVEKFIKEGIKRGTK